MEKLEQMKNLVLEMSRQNQAGELTPWFNEKLEQNINAGVFCQPKTPGVADDENDLHILANSIIDDLVQYREQTGVSTAVIGISGGVDSALTAILLKKAGWHVIGVVMPIHQNSEETERGLLFSNADYNLDVKLVDLSDEFDAMIKTQQKIDPSIIEDTKQAKIRRGNIRARLRMITLYNLAAANQGLVASTDNFSELAAGFWTLHGDVGDLSPIQSLTKSWEVPMMAKLVGVPESIWSAKPTDGLGVDAGDEAQFGFTYLELDLMLLELLEVIVDGLTYDVLESKGEWNVAGLRKYLKVEDDPRAAHVYDALTSRVGSTWFKRTNPVNIQHPFFPKRYRDLDILDRDLFHPDILK